MISMGRCNSKDLHSRDFRNNKRIHNDKKKPIQDLYMQRIKAMASEIKENKPKSKVFHMKEKDVQDEALSKALNYLDNEHHVELKDLQSKFYSKMAELIRKELEGGKNMTECPQCKSKSIQERRDNGHTEPYYQCSRCGYSWKK